MSARDSWKAYAVAVAAVAGATGARAALTPLWADRLPFITYFAAAAFAAWYGGLGPGVLATFLGGIAGVGLFFPSGGVLGLSSWEAAAGLLVFVAVNGFIAVLTEQLRRRQGAAREARAYAEALMGVYRELSQELDLGAVIELVVRRAREIVEADGAAFILREGDEVHYVAEEPKGALWAGQRFPATACISGWSILERQTVVIDDVYADNRIPCEAYRPTFVQSLVMVPVRRQDPLGALGLYWRTKHRATEPEVRLAEALADAAAVAVSNARAFADLRDAEGRAEESRHRAEQSRAAAEEARDEAEAASRAKDAFLATVSHELRTPLSPILAWSRMLLQGRLDASTTHRAYEVIERSARSQAQLVEDLLDVSRIVSGKLRLEVRPVDLPAVIERAVDVVRPSAEAKGIRLSVVLDTSTPAVSGDPERLQQVIWNLLSNAVKFTPKGGRVEIVLERVNSHVEIAVADTGPGVAPDFLPHVFERFRQADSTTTRTHGGLGLGLAIVRHLVEAHGGTVHAENAGEERGAIFTVKLPLMPTAARTAGELTRRHPTTAVEAASDDARLDGIRVLVVDDEPDSNEVVGALLSAAGAEVRVAASAPQAREVLGRWRPDVVVTDIGMPGEDGYALVTWLKAARDGTCPPAVALTAYASREDRVRLLSAGFQAHVAKPVDPDELVAVVASVARAD